MPMRILSRAHLRAAAVSLALLSLCLLAGCGQSLQSAAAKGDIQGIDRLLAQGAYVDATDSGGWTALHWAADYGKTEAAIAGPIQRSRLSRQART
jgi:ankyrin repeat protein